MKSRIRSKRAHAKLSAVTMRLRSTRIGRIIVKSPARTLIVLGVAILGTISLTMLRAASTYDPVSTSPKAVIIEYTTPHHDHMNYPTNLPTQNIPPFTLYGDGRLVCGKNNPMPFTAPMNMNMTMQDNQATSTYLNPSQIQNLIRQISATGFMQLNKEYYQTDPVAQHQSKIRLALYGGNYYTLYYNDAPPPTAYAKTLSILQSTCGSAKTPFQPANISLQLMRTSTSSPNTTSRSATNAKTVTATFTGNVATIVQNLINQANTTTKTTSVSRSLSVQTSSVVSTGLSSADAASLLTQLNGKQQAYVSGGDRSGTYQIRVVQPEPAVSNPLDVDYEAIRSITATAAVTKKRPVRFVVLKPKDAPDSDPAFAQAKSMARRDSKLVNSWYFDQTGKHYYTHGSVYVIRSSHTKAEFQSCNGCVPGAEEMNLSIMKNAKRFDKGKTYRPGSYDTVIYPGWSYDDPNRRACGWGTIGDGLAMVDVLHSDQDDNIVTQTTNPDGSTSTSVRGCAGTSQIGGSPQTAAHELGHTFGLEHTGPNNDASNPDTACTIMDSSAGACRPCSLYPESSTPTLVGYDIAPKCILDALQIPKVKKSRYYRGSSSSASYRPASSPLIGSFSILETNEHQYTGETLVSPNGMYRAELEVDGNLVVYNADDLPLWSSNTSGRDTAMLIMQNDGNLVQYDSALRAIWSTGTYGTGSGSRLSMQDDGNLVVYDSQWRATWSWRTGKIPLPVTPVLLYKFYNEGIIDNLYSTNKYDGARSLGYSYQGCVASVMPSYAPGTLPLHRYFNSGNNGAFGGDTFYTTTRNDAGYAGYGYSYVGIAGYVFTSQQAGTVPFKQYFAGAPKTDHFYTAEAWTSGFLDYNYEQIVGYVYPPPADRCGPTDPVPPSPNKIVLHHYYNPSIVDNFYTTNFNEIGYGNYGYSYYGCKAIVWDRQVPGSTPLWRYWNSTGGDHFYTVDRNDAGLAGYGYGIEGLEGYVFRGSGVGGTAPFNRYFAGYPKTDHYYTMDPWTSGYLDYYFERTEAYTYRCG